jgi:hypothetical protein
MNDSKMQIAIAEACGWKVHPKNDSIVIPPNSPNSVQPRHTLPDYLNDLNAMHEAEKVLSNGEFEDYFDELENQVPFASPGTKRRHICTATARQRAEALLKTLYLWKP